MPKTPSGSSTTFPNSRTPAATAHTWRGGVAERSALLTSSASCSNTPALKRSHSPEVPGGGIWSSAAARTAGIPSRSLSNCLRHQAAGFACEPLEVEVDTVTHAVYVVNDSSNSVSVITPSATATTTSLSVSPGGTAPAGGTVTLTATETPATAGTVQFFDGASALGSPVTVREGHGDVCHEFADARLALPDRRLHAILIRFHRFYIRSGGTPDHTAPTRHRPDDQAKRHRHHHHCAVQHHRTPATCRLYQLRRARHQAEHHRDRWPVRDCRFACDLPGVRRRE